MDHDSRTLSASSLIPTIHFSSTDSLSRKQPNNELTSSPFSPDASPTRQQRLLQNRNARFPAKKLSISSISSKLTQLIGNNEGQVDATARSRDQENNVPTGWHNTSVGRKSGLNILEEISNTAGNRSVRRKADVRIYQDTPERPLLQSSPYVASSPEVNAKYDYTSPLELGRVHDGLSDMRAKTRTPSERWSTLDSSPPESSSNLRRRSGRATYDQEEYIKHLEDRLHQLEQDAYSPLTRRPMKEKLMVVNRENERLCKELHTLKERFETEVKRTVEHKTAIEMELRKRVRDLEESLEEKETRMLEMQCQYTEERLNANTVETLKLTIERLEQEKLNMEQIHLSMNKRNETLTKLVVTGMSPPKNGSFLESASPNREKRNPRMSLILPKVPSSPTGSQLYSYSASASPVLLSSCEVSPMRLSTEYDRSCISETPDKSYFEPRSSTPKSNDGSLCSPATFKPLSRRSTMHIEPSMLAATSNTVSSTTVTEARPPTKRKARRFLAGSTQLKPLLLPTLTSEPSSVVPTPLTSYADIPQFETISNADSVSDADLTILARDLAFEAFDHDETINSPNDPLHINLEHTGGDPGPAYASEEEQLSEKQSERYDEASVTRFADAEVILSDEIGRISEESIPSSEMRNLRSLELELWSNLSDQHSESHSPLGIPIPSLTDRLAVIPLPLFSPIHHQGVHSSMPSRTPSEASELPVKVRKRRQRSSEQLTQLPQKDEVLCSVGKVSSRLSGSLLPDQGFCHSRPMDRPTSRIRSSDNFLDLLRQKNFAVKPLTAITIRTVYKILSACTGAVRDFQRNPFALARRVLANAWRMNWRVLGKLSWWVLGLFVHPDFRPRTRPAIEWDQYDGESIAARYCDPETPESVPDNVSVAQQEDGLADTPPQLLSVEDDSSEKNVKPGLLHSVLLWGKFSAAIMLAISGAIVKGPKEMMKSTEPATAGVLEREQMLPRVRSSKRHGVVRLDPFHSPQATHKNHEHEQVTEYEHCSIDCDLEPSFDISFGTPSPPDQYDETGLEQMGSIDGISEIVDHPGEVLETSSHDDQSDRTSEPCIQHELGVAATQETAKKSHPRAGFDRKTQPFRLYDELSDSSCTH